jgi:cobalt transporter subunit CbtB
MIASPETGLKSFHLATRGGRARADRCPAVACHAATRCAVHLIEKVRLMSSSTLSSSISASHPLSHRILLAVGSMLLGAVLIFLAGFSHLETLHNAAHDTRHSAAFPCH